jgi:ABC-type nitrate/sulfonate/bicarbonate transport system permease component
MTHGATTGRDGGAPAVPGRALLQSAQYAAFPVALLAAWQVCAQIGLVRRAVLPAPTDVAMVWFDLITGATDAAARYSGIWLGHAAASIWRVVAGFAWGGALGILAGLLIGSRCGKKRARPPCSSPTTSMRRSISLIVRSS